MRDARPSPPDPSPASGRGEIRAENGVGHFPNAISVSARELVLPHSHYPRVVTRVREKRSPVRHSRTGATANALQALTPLRGKGKLPKRARARRVYAYVTCPLYHPRFFRFRQNRAPTPCTS